MKVSDYVLKRLADEGCDTAFTVYGGAMAEMADAFTRQTAIRYVCTQHEQGAGFAAEGYSKAKGVPGLVVVTSGPGLGNIVTAIQNAYYDSVPLLALSGQVATNLIRGKNSRLRQNGFQETDAVGIAKPITKYAVQAEGAMHATYCIDTALLQATSGRPGPVLLDLPTDVQKGIIPYDTQKSSKPEAFFIRPEKARAFMGDLAEAKRPGILVGGGAYKAREQIMAFAEKHRIPVFRTWNALDVATDDSAAYAGTVGTYGGPGRNFGVQNCDLLLILGCRISGRITGGKPQTFAAAAKKYWVDIDVDLLAEHEVRCDVTASTTVEAFMDVCASGEYSTWTLNHGEWLAKCRIWLKAYDPVKPQMMDGDFHHYGFMRKLSEKIPANAIVVYDTGGNAIMMGHCFRSKKGQRIFSSNGNTPMGFALCGAIGAWFAAPDRPIVCIIGDGGMQLNIQELQTIKHYGANVRCFVINNEVLGNTKAYQRVNGRPEICCGPDGYSSPDFVAIADAYKIPAMRITKWEDMYIADLALCANTPSVVDVLDPDRCTYEPRVSRWDTPIHDMEPFLPREEFNANNTHTTQEPSETWEGVN